MARKNIRVLLKSRACAAKWREVPFTKPEGLGKEQISGANQEAVQLT